MALNNISLENAVCVFPKTFQNEEVKEKIIYQQKIKLINSMISSAFKETGLRKDEIEFLIKTIPELWLKLIDDYPLSKIVGGVKNAYEKTRMKKSRNPGIGEILNYIDSNIDLRKYI